jgi:hypothetical protein
MSCIQTPRRRASRPSGSRRRRVLQHYGAAGGRPQRQRCWLEAGAWSSGAHGDVETQVVVAASLHTAAPPLHVSRDCESYELRPVCIGV